MIYQINLSGKEKLEICHKACLGKNKLDTKTELKKQNNPIWPNNPRWRTFSYRPIK
jgi:hypothetical protein